MESVPWRNQHLDTPAALVDVPRMQANIERMQARMDGLGVKLRPHVKTSKCLPVVRAQLEAGARGMTLFFTPFRSQSQTGHENELTPSVPFFPGSACS